MYRLFLGFLLMFALFSGVALASEDVAAGVVVEEAWIVPSSATFGSLYLVINNLSSELVVLKSVSSPLARSMRVVRPSGEEFANGAAIPIHSELYMQPGGVHVTFEAPKAPLEQGQEVPVTVRLSSGKSAEVSAVVLAPGASTPDHHDYEH